MRIKKFLLIPVLCACLWALAGCDSPDPLITYVTATPGGAAPGVTGVTGIAAIPTASVSVTVAAPTIEATLIDVPVVTETTTLERTVVPTLALPTETPTLEATAVPTLAPTEVPSEVPPTEVPTLALPTDAPSTEVAALPPPTAGPLRPTNTIMGPVIGEGYIIPPSSTPPAAPATETLPPAVDGAATLPVALPTDVPPTPGTAVVMPNLDPERIGVQLDINLTQEDWNDAMGRAQNLGVRWIKVQLSWRDMQPNGPGEQDNEFFRLVELHLEDAARRGFSVLVSVVKAPTWARSNQAEDGPPDDPQALAAFVSLILNEFNAGLATPQLGEYIDAVEIWNEPNLIREWQGTLPFTGAGYMRLFAASYQAVRGYSATMPIITAGLAPTGTSAGSVDDREFLRQMYGAGLASYTDVQVGVHPYSWGNEPDAVCCGSRGWDEDPHFFFGDTMREYRAIMDANGHNVMLFVTEFGYASWDGLPGDPPEGSQWMRFNDRYQQGLYTIRALEILQSTPNIGPVMLWNLNFGVLSGLIDNRDERVAYSLILPGTLGVIDPTSLDRTERPLFWMLYDAVRPDVTLPRFD